MTACRTTVTVLTVAVGVAVGGAVSIDPAGRAQSRHESSSNETPYLAQGPGDPSDHDCWEPNGGNTACDWPNMMGPDYGDGFMGPGMMGPYWWHHD